MDPAPMSAARYILPKKELNKTAPIRLEQFFALEIGIWCTLAHF